MIMSISLKKTKFVRKSDWFLEKKKGTTKKRKAEKSPGIHHNETDDG